ncbi:MAG: UDP-N-acetylmuramoyl-L-alanine--D-glutamate ligase [Lachnospiraceae bacterium]|nr:UDP-N-acetylmuramoyl-L-alanine--D-glutamate ligase [Lachnospiraceae bacterium]
MKTLLRSIVENRLVVLLGYGREGKSTLRMLREEVGGYGMIAVADRNQVEVDDPNVILFTGETYQQCLDDFDVIIKSPGIVFEDKEQEKRLIAAHKLYSQVDIFFAAYRDRIIGITGTKGKSTTTTLIYHILKNAGHDVVLAGNIGIPAFDVVKQIKKDTVIVFELSSHMLEFMQVSPHIACYLNIHEEHLDHYENMAGYVRAKENIYRYQKPGDILLINEQMLPKKEDCASEIISIGYGNIANIPEGMLVDERYRVVLSEDENPNSYGSPVAYVTIRENRLVMQRGLEREEFEIPVDEIALLGEHNYFNIAFAYAVCMGYGLSHDTFVSGLRTYETLPHRLQFVGVVDGIKYYDDSISTICDTTISALRSVKDVTTILIGGMDRGIDYQELISYLSQDRVAHIVLMADTGKRIYDEISGTDFKRPERLHLVKTLEEAVAYAREVTPRGTSCVLSPAAASYGIFKNFEERGDVFQALVLGKK